jgi:hypothetical protein
MNLSRFAPSLLAVTLLVSSPAVALAQTASGANAAIAKAIAELNSGDRERVMAGRKALIDGMIGLRDPQALGQYAADVASAVPSVLQGSDPHAKLNAAIAVQRIADQTGSVAMAPVVSMLIADPSPAIATYGLRAASNVLPRVLANAALESEIKLVDKIIAAVSSHPSSEAIATEAYAALTKTLSDRDAANLLGANVVTLATPRVIDGINALNRQRMAMEAGSISEPIADLTGVNFLSRQGNWALMNQSQRDQSMTSLLRTVRRSVEEMQAIEARRTPGPDRERLLAARALNRAAIQGLGVYASPQLLNNAELRKTTALVASLNNGSPTSEYDRISRAVVADFVAAFPAMKAGLDPTTAPQVP